MKVYEFGERCEHEGILWSGLVTDNAQSFDVVKTALVAKFELNVSLTAEALDEHDDPDYISAHLEKKTYDVARLVLARKAESIEELCRIDTFFVRHRDVAEYVGCDYWSLLAAKEVKKAHND
jgi:hypothetical protein